MNDFYVYLPSNSSFLAENNSSKYVTKLAKELNLGDAWLCGLKEIHYPKTWNTLKEGENEFYVERKEENSWQKLTIPSGHYDDERQLITTLNHVLTPLGARIDLSKSMNVPVLTIPKEKSFTFSEPLSSMLGLGYETVHCTHPQKWGEFPMNLTRGIDAVYVYTDIVQSKLVGDSNVPLLAVVPLKGEYGDMVFQDYINPTYAPLSKHVFSTIEIYIADSSGKQIAFSSGKLTVLLHFRHARNTSTNM